MMSASAADEHSIPTRTLIAAMIDGTGRLESGPLFAAAADCGMSDQQVRLCLRRMVAAGTLARVEGRGRHGAFQAAAGRETMPEIAFLRLAARQDAGRSPWDGIWRLVAFSIPERRRAQRDLLRRRLTFLGAGQISSGLYLSPHPWQDLVLGEAEEIGVASMLTLASTTDLEAFGIVDPQELSSRIWPLGELADRYASFEHPLQRQMEEIDDLDGAQLVRVALGRAVDLARLLGPDPLLPPELLPRDWPGARTRARFKELLTRLAERGAELGSPLPTGIHRMLDAYESEPVRRPSQMKRQRCPGARSRATPSGPCDPAG